MADEQTLSDAAMKSLVSYRIGRAEVVGRTSWIIAYVPGSSAGQA
jgi:hypothetical protein